MKKYLQKAIIVLFYGIVELFNHIGLALDNIFYPSYRGVIIKSPLFVVSMPRTGTTWLQNVLCADREQITSMKLWEMLYAPSIIQKKFFLFLSKTDKRFNCFLGRRLRRLDIYLFRDYNPIHPSSFFGYEDDDLVLLHIFSNLFLIFFFPGLKLYDFLMRFDQSADEKRKKKIMTFYRKCIQKHLYVFGKDKIYFSKSASHIPKMHSLQQTFPDGCFIYTARFPEQVVPSAISLYIRFSEIFHTPVELKTITERTLRTSDYLFSYPLEVFKSWPGNRYFVNLYDDLVENIEREVKRMYDHFGIPLSDKFSLFLAEERCRAQSFKSAHVYDPEKWGLPAKEIRSRYNEAFEQYSRLVSREAGSGKREAGNGKREAGSGKREAGTLSRDAFKTNR